MATTLTFEQWLVHLNNRLLANRDALANEVKDCSNAEQVIMRARYIANTLGRQDAIVEMRETLLQYAQTQDFTSVRQRLVKRLRMWSESVYIDPLTQERNIAKTNQLATFLEDIEFGF